MPLEHSVVRGRHPQAVSAQPDGILDPASLQATTRIYVDFASLYNGAHAFSAVRRSRASSIAEASQRHILDPYLRVSATATLDVLAGYNYDSYLVRPVCVFSTKRGVPSPLAPAFDRAGWLTIERELGYNGREKGVDMTVCGQALEDNLATLGQNGPDPSEVSVIMVTGDGDYVDTVTRLRRFGYHVAVMAWSHTFSYSLRSVASSAIELDVYFDLITFRET
jgi:hypothetical protein